MAGDKTTVDSDLEKIKELEKNLIIDPHGLDDELKYQADSYYRISKLHALLSSRRDAAKQELSETEAEVDQQLRATAAKEKEKVTERDLDAMKKIDEDVVKANRHYLDLSKKTALALALKESYQQRSYALKDLVSLYIASYYSDSTEETSMNRVKTIKAEKAKRAMAEQRKDYR